MKKILCNWYYERQDLTKHLLELTEKTQLTFIAKHHRPQKDERENLASENLSIIYWGDYNSPYQILDAVQPDLVIFHDIEAFNQIALNIAAKNRKIKTYVLQHGLRGGYEVDDAFTNAAKNGKMEISNTSWWTLKFLLRSLKLKNLLHLFPLIKFIVARKKNELTVALYKNQFELRRADLYVEFSKANATYHKIRDGIPDNRFVLIGNPSYDDFYERIKNISQEVNTEPYALLIDSPFLEANFVQKQRMSTEEKNGYIKRLNEYCKQKKIKLLIKLHPLSYGAAYLYTDENIQYARNADIVQLIGRAELVFLVHFSTLAPLVIHQKPFFFFGNKYFEHNDFISSLSIPIYDLINFSPLELANSEPHPPLKAEAIVDYLFIPDGKATERLKQLILS